MNELICHNCGKKLAEIKMDNGKVEIKCSKCGTTNSVEAKKEKAENDKIVSSQING